MDTYYRFSHSSTSVCSQTRRRAFPEMDVGGLPRPASTEGIHGVTVQSFQLFELGAGHRNYPQCLHPAFNLHGMSTSTHFSAPLIVVNGPIRERIGLNCSFGVFGPGYRANATIGRALRLVMINLGGAKPGETSMSTFGHPGRYTYCIGEF